MSAGSGDSLSLHPPKPSDDEVHAQTVSQRYESEDNSPFPVSTPVISFSDDSNPPPRTMVSAQGDSHSGNSGKLTFARLASGLGLSFSARSSGINKEAEGTSGTVQSGVLETLTKGIVDTSLGAVKAVQVKARHIVSQNKRRYQEGGFDLDMTYITENIIAMGFPGGDISSGFFGYVEGFYRNHMEEVIKFFETHHKGQYKVYNLCSERLYDSALFQGKVASFPFEDHNCPPIELISLFCLSAYTWLKEDIQNVVVVHCKAGLGRTGLMICSLLLFLKFFPTAEECIDYFNQKRCIDGKGITNPSQIRYVKYFERLLTYFNGENQPGRRCMLRGFRLHNCPYWIRPSITIYDHNGILFTTKKHPKTKDLMPEDFWIRAVKKGIVVFALPGEPGLTELKGDFKIQFHDRHGDFYCWLNTTMTENRIFLDNSELDGFEKRRLPSPGFQVEIVMIDYDGSVPTKKNKEVSNNAANTPGSDKVSSSPNPTKASKNQDDDVFSDSDGEESGPAKGGQARAATEDGGTSLVEPGKTAEDERTGFARTTSNAANETTKSVGVGGLDMGGVNDIKAMAADASVFTFGDDEDYESE